MKLSKLFTVLLLLCLIASTANADRRRLNRFTDLVVTSTITLPNTGDINFEDAGGTAQTLLTVTPGDDWILGSNNLDGGYYDVATGFGHFFRENGTTVATFDSGGLDVSVVGSQSTPSLTLGDGDTGIYGAADTLRATVAGTLDLTITDNQITVADGTEFTFGNAVGTSTGVLCRKSDGNVGQCTSAVGAGGTCTCS